MSLLNHPSPLNVGSEAPITRPFTKGRGNELPDMGLLDTNDVRLLEKAIKKVELDIPFTFLINPQTTRIPCADTDFERLDEVGIIHPQPGWTEGFAAPEPAESPAKATCFEVDPSALVVPLPCPVSQESFEPRAPGKVSEERAS